LGSAHFAALTPRNSCGAAFSKCRKARHGASTLAGLHSPQGRVIALLAVVRTSADEFCAVLPRHFAPGSLNACKFVLQARWSSKRSRAFTACSALRTRPRTRHRQSRLGHPPPCWRRGTAASSVADAAALARWRYRHC
jgi:hypothetical protein